MLRFVPVGKPVLCCVFLLSWSVLWYETPAFAQTPPVAPHTVDPVLPTPIPLLAIPAPPDVPVRPLTADEAAQIALRRQPTVAAALANIEAAQGRTQQVHSGLLPTLTLSGSYTHVEALTHSSSAGTGAVAGGGGTGVNGGTGSGSTGTGGTGTGGTGSAGTGTGAGGTGTGGTGSTGGTGTGGTGGTGTGGGSGGSSGGTGLTTVTPLGGSSSTVIAEGWQGSAVVRQLLYDFNHTRDLVRQSAALERAAQQTLSRVQSDLVNQVKQAYYLYAQNLQLVDVQNANVVNRQSQLALARARLNAGLGLPADLATAETALSQAAVALSLAQNNAAQTRIGLALLMGIDPRTPLVPTTTGEAPLPSDDVNGLIVTALRQRPEVLVAQANIDASQFGLNAARTTNAPVVSGNLQFLSRGADLPTGTNDFAIGAAIQFSPFDGGLTQGKVKEARGNLNAAQANLLAAQQQAAADVAQAYLALRSAEQRVGIADAEVANAAENVRIAEGRYRAGLGLFLDIINAQAFLVTARTDQLSARATVDQSRAALKRAVGTRF